MFPYRGYVHLKRWLASDTANKDKLDWLNEFLDLLTIMSNQEYKKAKPLKNKPPIPFYAEVAEFYLSVARHNLPKQKPPDWKVHGVGIDFYVICYPYPRYIPAPIGEINLSDKKFQELLVKYHKSDFKRDPESDRLAAKYAHGEKPNNTEKYIGLIKHDLLDAGSARCTFHSYLISKEEQRAPVLKNLVARFDKNDNDAVLYGLCLLAPSLHEEDFKQIVKVLKVLIKRSPYLATKGIRIMRHPEIIFKRGNTKNAVNQVLKEMFIQQSPKPSEFYRFLFKGNVTDRSQATLRPINYFMQRPNEVKTIIQPPEDEDFF